MPRVAARLFGEPDALADSRAADKESAMKRQAYLALSIGFIVVGVILIYPAWLSQHVSQVTFLARGIILLWLLVGVGAGSWCSSSVRTDGSCYVSTRWKRSSSNSARLHAPGRPRLHRQLSRWARRRPNSS